MTGFAASVTVGAASSSVIVNVAFNTDNVSLEADPETVTRLCRASAVTLFTAVIVTSPVLVVAFAATVSVFAADSVKSPATVGDTPVAATVIVTALFTALGNVAVTVVLLVAPLSSIVEGVSVNLATAIWAANCAVVSMPAYFKTGY